jgi:ABC-2 type transport system permease protein
MIPVLGAEVLKLRTIRSPYLIAIAAQLIVVAGISGLVFSGGDLRDSATLGKAFAHVGLASLVTLILGIVASAGEFRHKSVTDTYLSVPQRGAVLAAKLATVSAVALLIGLACALTATATAAAWWTAKGAPLHLGSGAVWRAILGGLVWDVAFAAIGVGIGALARNLAGATASALAWIALVEGIVGQLVGSQAARWLPFRAGQALGTTGQFAHPLPQWGAGLLLVGYAAGIAIVGRCTTVRRDVT